MRLSHVLRAFCTFALCLSIAVTVAAAFLPMVSVEKVYARSPAIHRQQAAMEAPAQTDPWNEPENHWFLSLAGGRPKIALFNYQPDDSALKPEKELHARLLALLTLSYGILGAWVFRRLFASYAEGRIFEVESIRQLKHIAWWLIGTFPVGLTYSIAMNQWTSVHFTIYVNPDDKFFFGLFMFAIAAIMQEAVGMKEQLEDTV